MHPYSIGYPINNKFRNYDHFKSKTRFYFNWILQITWGRY